MKRKDKQKKDRVKALLTIIAGLAVLSAFMVILGGHWFWEDFTSYYIRFTSVKDLNAGRPVKYGGLDIGRIQKIELDSKDPRYIKVIIGVQSDFPLYQGVKASIAQKGLVGDFYVYLDLTGEPGPRLEPGAEIPAVKIADIQELAAKVGDMITDIKPKIEKIFNNLNELFSDENIEALRAMLRKGPGFMDDVKRAVGEAQADWKRLVEGGLSVTRSMNETLGGVDQRLGSAEKELRTTLQELRKQADKAGKLAESLRAGFEYDQGEIEEILENVNRSSKNMKALIGKLRERPWEVLRPPSGAEK